MKSRMQMSAARLLGKMFHMNTQQQRDYRYLILREADLSYVGSETSRTDIGNYFVNQMFLFKATRLLTCEIQHNMSLETHL